VELITNGEWVRSRFSQLGTLQVQISKQRASVTSAPSNREYEEDGFTVTGEQVEWRVVHIRAHKVAVITFVCCEV